MQSLDIKHCESNNNDTPKAIVKNTELPRFRREIRKDYQHLMKRHVSQLTSKEISKIEEIESRF